MTHLCRSAWISEFISMTVSTLGSSSAWSAHLDLQNPHTTYPLSAARSLLPHLAQLISFIFTT